MQNHGYCEELCALAATGELSAAEWADLRSHCDGCPQCRQACEEFLLMHTQWLPEHSKLKKPRQSYAEANLRERILQTAEAQGADFSRAARAAALPTVHPSVFRKFLSPTLAFAAGVLITFVTVKLELQRQRRV